MTLRNRPPFISHWRTRTPVCAIDTYTTSRLSNSMVAPHPAVSLDLNSFGISTPCLRENIYWKDDWV